MPDPEAEARKTAEQFVEGFNTRNPQMVRDAMHFPQVRFAGGRVFVVETVEAWQTPFERMEQAEGWHHSTLDSMQAFHVTEDKVHPGVVFTRCHADGTSYATHNSLWIIIRKDGRWGIQGRSSYAP